jgi:transglutaminase-like putative cysteine protease
VIRVSVWLIRRLGTNAIVAVALMLVALGSVALGLADSVHGLDLGLLLPVAVLGLLCGWALAKSPLPGWLGAVVALTLGVEVIFVRIGRLAEPLVALLRALVDSLIGLLVFLGWGFWQVHQSEWPDNLPDATPLLLAWQELWADSGIVLLRLWNWLAGLVMGESSFDLVAVALVWSLVFFLGATWAGWWARRHNRPLVGMAPAGALLSACLFFARSDPVFVLPLMGATLLLMALIGQDARERRWSATGVDFPSDVSSEVKLVGAGLSLMLVTTAALVPSITWRQVVDRAGRLVAGRPNNVQVVTGPVGPDVEPPSPATALDRDQVRTPGLPRLHLLGSGPELSKQVVMFVYVAGDQDTADGNTSGPSELTPEESTPHYYWRSLTYDRYTGRGWTTGGTRTLEYQAGDLALYKDPLEPVEVGGRPAEVIPPGYRKVQAEVRAVSALGELLHTTGDLLTVDRGYRVAWRSHEDAFGATIILAEHVPSGMGTRPPAPDTPAQTNRVGSDSGIGTPNTRISTQVVENTPVVYRTTSLVSAVGEAQLRAAASDYPGWVEERYLALPDSVPPRVLALARDLTVTEPTPYDQARAIESYLRTFSYNLDLPSPHFERDVVDYFLFDLKQGYCDYYATSMVVLARAAGLPARLAVGYFTGSYDEVNHRYVVTEADAHAWVEIYFPGYGWIEFEPTAGIPPIHRPADLPPVLPPEPGALDVGQPEVSSLWWLGLVAAIGLLSLGSLGRSALDSWRLRRMPPEVTLATLYRRFRRHGQRLAVPMQPGNTPYEYLTSFTEHVAGVAQRSAWAALLVPGAQEARWLIGLYVRTCYGPQSPDVADQRQAIRTWRHLHRRLWVVWVSHVWEAALQIISASIHSAHRVERLPGD